MVSVALIFSQKQKYYFLEDKPVIKYGFLRSEENINLNDFQQLMVYECWCVLYFFMDKWCKLTTAMADVVPLCCIGRCYAMADVVAILMMWQMVTHRGRCNDLFAEQSGRCYCHCDDMWQMVSHGVACYNLMLIKWQMSLPKWQMEWPTGGWFY